MPYEVRGPNGDGEFEVVNKDTGKVKAKHASEEKAKAQVRLLEGIEHGMVPRG